MKQSIYLLVTFLVFVGGIGFGQVLRLDTVTAYQGQCRTFPETGKPVCGRFLEYWQANGGLAQQGLPLSGEFTEVSDLNGQSYTVQYFERAVFEKHPENARPNDVLLSQLGTFQFKRKYPNGEPTAGGPPATVPPAQAVPDIRTQTIEFRGNGATFRGTVTDVKETKVIPPYSITDGGTARGKFIVVLITVTNTGNASASTGKDGLKLRDAAGRTFDQVDDFDIWYPATKIYGTANFNDNLQPGVATPMVWLYDIPEDVTKYYLVAAGQ